MLPQPAAEETTSKACRVIVADDHQLLRECITQFLHEIPGLKVVANACDGAQAVALTRLLRPEIVIMDVEMPVMDGIEATRAIIRDLPDTHVIGLSAQGRETGNQMLAAGACCYVTKGDPAQRLLAAIASTGAADFDELTRFS